MRSNGFQFKPSADELLAMMLGIADGTVSFEQLAEWAESQVK